MISMGIEAAIEAEKAERVRALEAERALPDRKAVTEAQAELAKLTEERTAAAEVERAKLLALIDVLAAEADHLIQSIQA